MPPFTKGQVAEIRQQAHDVVTDRLPGHERECQVGTEVAVFREEMKGKLRLIWVGVLLVSSIGSAAGAFLAKLLGL